MREPQLLRGMAAPPRPLRWALWACLCLALLAPLAVRADAPAATEATFSIAGPLLSGRSPLVALDAWGAPQFLWPEPAPGGASARLMWASLPEAQPLTVTEALPLERISGLSPQHPGYALAADRSPWAAWAHLADDARMVQAASPEGVAGARWRVPSDASLWTFALDQQGGLAGAWLGPEGLSIYHTGQGITISLPLDPALTVDRLQLALDEQGQGYVAWSAREGDAAQSGVWYAPLASGATPIPAATEGLLADMALGPDGALHLAWFAPEGLYYANNQTRDGRRLVEPGLSAATPVALVASGGSTAHLAWLRDGGLWYAASAEWELSRTLLYEPAGAQGLALAVDDWSAPRLIWAEKGDAPDAPRLRLLRPFTPTPNLRVTWPLEGQVVTGDTVARVAANCPPADWLRIEFYIQQDGPADGQFGALRELGIDRDGSDGWQMPLPTEGLDPNRRYRIMALGITRAHGMLRAVSGWFQANSADELWLWPHPSLSEASGEITLAISLPAGAERLTRLDLYLASSHTHIRQKDAPGAAEPVTADHFISLPVQGAPDRPSVRLNTRDLPDGTYHLTAQGYTAGGAMIPGRASSPLTINNTLAPTLSEIAATLLDAVTGETELTARAEDLHRQPDRVGFYLQKAPESAFRGNEPAMADLVWAGNGEPNDGGWRTRLIPEPSWYDQSWIIWAIACDAGERCASLRADHARVLWPSERPPLLLTQPTGGAALQGTETIRLAAGPEAGQVLSATAWLEQPAGGLLPLGDLAREGPQWTLLWDTTLHRDDAYRLLVWATLDDGSEAGAWSNPLTVANRQPRWRFVAPATAQRVQGLTPITLAPLEGAPAVARITLYARDARGALAPLGEAQPHQGQWSLLWNSHEALDGNHVLVAELADEQGALSFLEHAVEVQNARPTIALLRGPGAAPVKGLERTVWYAQHPAGQPMTVTVEYSPDDGGHWQPLAPDLPAGVSLTWDSASVPDSDAAHLRITVTDGVYARQVTHGPFVVANVNDPPSITLLSPRPGETLGRSATIAWQAADPDAQEVRVALYVRLGEAPWQLLAEGLPGVGSYAWDTTDLAPGQGYALRALARDSGGATGAELAQGLSIVDNDPPEVELVWPSEHVRLNTEAVILWRARDPDGDPLFVDLYYSDNGGLTWFPLAEDLQDGGYYVWQVSFLPPGNSYRLKVVARDGYFVSQDQGHGLIVLGDDQPPQIELLSPVAGATLAGVWPIRWWTIGPVSDDVEIDILTRLAGWDTWRPLAEGLRHSDTYLWDTRRYSNGTYDLLVRARLGGQRALSSIIGSLRVRNEPKEPVQVALLAPSGGEFWTGLREVRWQLRGGEGRTVEASVEVSPDAGVTWHTLATVDAAQGRYLWQTDGWPSGSRYLMRITATDGETTSVATAPGAFSLAGARGSPPQLTITSPSPLGALAGGNLITWIAEDADDDPLLIDISLSEDGGQSWQQVAARLLNTGEYPLSRPLASDRLYQVELAASDGLYSVRVRSALFPPKTAERAKPSLALLAPMQGAVASGETPIQWRATDPAGLRLLVDIAYSADGGQTWTPLATGLENDGLYAWDTLPLANGVYLLRLTADNGRLRQSIVGEPFEIANPGRNAPRLSWGGPGMSDLQISAHELVWRAWDADGDPITLALAYSLGPYGPWLPLAHGLANTGRYVWDPTSVPSTSDLWLRLTATDGRFRTAIVSEGPLLAHHPASPRVQIVAPTGGELWTGKQQVRWQVTHGGGLVDVSLQRSLDGGITWEILGAGLPAVGSFLWDTAQAPDGSPALLRILATRGAAEGAATLAAPIVISGNECRDMFPLPFR